MARDARDSDFFGEGTADQGTAKPLSLYERNQLEEAARKRRLDERKPTSNQALPTGADVTRGRKIDPRTGKYYDEAPKPGSGSGFGEWFDSAPGTLKAISEDPVTMSILLAPYGVVGAGAAIGGPQALGFGLGEGSIAGGSTPGLAFKDAVAPTLTRTPSAFPGGLSTPGAASASSSAAPAAASSAAGPAAAWTMKDTAHAAIPLLGSLGMEGVKALVNGGDSKEDKALRAKQEQLAREAELRRQQTQTARMDAMGQRMAAFSPMNQRMAQMLGPEAAFQPSQLADMVANPMKPQLPPELMDYQGNDQSKLQQIRDYNAATHKYAADEEARRQRVMSGVAPLPSGPAPLSMPTPAAARRY